MGLETGSYIAALNSSNPVSGDPLSQADDHMKFIKEKLKETFPGSGGTGFASAITATEAEINRLVGVTSGVQTQLNAKAASGSNTDITSLNAPALGAATATTQAGSDSSTKVATTAHVHAAIATDTVIASTAEAQALSDNTKHVSPLRLKEALQGGNQTLASTGEQKFPGGLIIKWGLSSSIAHTGTQVITFANVFPTACISIQVTPSVDLGNVVASGFAYNASASGFTLKNETSGAGFNCTYYWLAIGY